MDRQEIPREILVLQFSLELIDVEAVMKISPSLKLKKACIRPQTDRLCHEKCLSLLEPAPTAWGAGGMDRQTATVPGLQRLPGAL